MTHPTKQQCPHGNDPTHCIYQECNSVPLTSKQRCYVIPVGPDHHIESLLDELLRQHHYTFWVNYVAMETTGGVTRPTYTLPPAVETKTHRCRSCSKLIPWTAGDSPAFCAYCGASLPVETSDGPTGKIVQPVPTKATLDRPETGGASSWCEICGGKDGEHQQGCVDGDSVL